MEVEGVLRSSVIAALLFLTLLVLAAAEQCHNQLADDEPYMLGAALANTTAADDDEQGYMLVGMQTGGGDKIRLVIVAGQRYFSITGFAQGFFLRPKWFFREGERRRLLTTLGNGGSHAEVVASSACLLH